MTNKFNKKLYWVTGLSGSGKTTLANLLIKKFRSNNEPVVLIDGDVIREIFDNSDDYSMQSRLNTAYQYSKLGKFIVNQGFNVVCSTISLFHEIHKFNRENIPNYREIFIDVSLDELIRRDNKNIYSRAIKKELKNVVGFDIKPEFPKNPDIIIKSESIEDLQHYVDKIIKL